MSDDIRNPEEIGHEVGRFSTELGAEIVLTTDPRLGNGLMFHIKVDAPDRVRESEVYLNDDVISNLTGAFAGHLLSIAFAPLKEILDEQALKGLDEKGD